MSMDEKEWELYQSRKMAEIDYNSGIASAREEGREEGEKVGIEKGERKGKKEAKIQIAKKLIDEGIVINSREMKDNPLVSAIRFSNAFLVEELMKNYRNLIVTYSNEYVRNCSVLDIAERTKNEKIINIVKKYLV